MKKFIPDFSCTENSLLPLPKEKQKAVLSRACLKNHSFNLHTPLCGILYLNSITVARYGTLLQIKTPTNCDAHLTKSIFQTRSNSPPI